jgi:dipeptidyl aminopeptidase/acylaminoacyl peptidase
MWRVFEGPQMWRVLLATGAACLAAAASAPGAAAPLQAYGKLPSIEQIAVSPDGLRIASVVTDGEQRDVVIESLPDLRVIGGLRAGAGKVRDVRWAGPNHLLVTVSRTGYINGVMSPESEWRAAIDYNVVARSQHWLLEDVVATDGLRVVQDTPAVRVIGGKTYAFVQGVQFVGDEGVGSLYRIDLDAHRSMVKAQASSRTDQWLVGPDGEPLARTEYDPKSGDWVLQAARAGHWRDVQTVVGKIEHPSLLGLGEDDSSALVSQSEGDKVAVRELGPSDSVLGPTKLAQQNYGLIFDPVTDALIGTHELVGDEDRYTFFRPTDQAEWSAIVRAFPGQRVGLASVYEDPDGAGGVASMSQDHRKVIVVADSPTEGPGYFLVDVDTGKARFLGPVYSGLQPADVSEVRSIAFKAADGMPLTGYLTLPRAREARNLPLIVFPHGGPAARDEPGFDWWAQAMASRGYAVLQVNYRGSDGFGWDFLEAGFGQWGRKMQTDLSDGVRYLAAQGVVDAKRVCILGASYGGYAALAGAALDPGVYRCAVDIAGPAELKRFVAWAQDRSDARAERYWTRFIGAENLADPRLEELSPADHADRITIPILVIHGKDDTVVPFEQSQVMVDALKRAGKPAEMVVLDHEDHWLSHGDTRLQMLRATMDFLAKNNPAD